MFNALHAQHNPRENIIHDRVSCPCLASTLYSSSLSPTINNWIDLQCASRTATGGARLSSLSRFDVVDHPHRHFHVTHPHRHSESYIVSRRLSRSLEHDGSSLSLSSLCLRVVFLSRIAATKPQTWTRSDLEEVSSRADLNNKSFWSPSAKPFLVCVTGPPTRMRLEHESHHVYGQIMQIGYCWRRLAQGLGAWRGDRKASQILVNEFACNRPPVERI